MPDDSTTSTSNRPAPDLFGTATFWSVVATAALATLLLYCWPAAQRIDRQAAALETAEARLAEVKARHDKLQAECRALDDPFYIEKMLRFEHNWRPRSGHPASGNRDRDR